MDKPLLHLVKIGGNILDNEPVLKQVLSGLSGCNEHVMLVHGGGKAATALSEKLDIPVQMIDGRRVTGTAMLDVAVMVYAGLINKKIVACLQAYGKNAIGLCGADAGIIPARKREVDVIDYGWVGDVDPGQVSSGMIQALLQNNLMPVIAPVTHDGKGQLLNTNADAIAAALAIALAPGYDVRLYYCFEKKGVLADSNRDDSVLARITSQEYLAMKDNGQVHSGMIPKLDRAFAALEEGVKHVHILHAQELIKAFNEDDTGTKLVR